MERVAFACLVLQSWWWRRHFPSDRLLTLKGLFGLMSQNVELATAVKSWNSTLDDAVSSTYVWTRARGSVVVKEICYKPKGSGLKTRWDEWIFSIYLILPAALGPGVHSASNRQMSTRRRKIMFLGNIVRPVRRADKLIAIGEPIILTMWDPQHHNPIGLHGLLRR
jgi:hypothetical protein